MAKTSPPMPPLNVSRPGFWVVGFDGALAEMAAFAALVDVRAVRGGDPGKGWFLDKRVLEITTDADQGIDARLDEIYKEVVRFSEDVSGHDPDGVLAAAVEGFSFGSRFRREDMGAAVASIRLAWRHTFESLRSPPPMRVVTPARAKAAVYPEWHGFSLANWKAAGKTAKFKRSMPDKDSVRSAFFRRFEIGDSVICSSHVCDAACVAVATVEQMVLGRK
jgi:hypothetical protein